VPQRLLKVSRSFGSSGIQEFFLVVLPALTPYLLIAARIGLTHALRAAVTAEMFVKIGFGGMVIDAGLDMSTANLLGMLVILAVISTGATVVLDSLARRAAPWYESRIEAR
jgi:ABC-type nitrate/sulfonate/bicarbonate transport system permease component